VERYKALPISPRLAAFAVWRCVRYARTRALRRSTRLFSIPGRAFRGVAAPISQLLAGGP